MSITEDESPRPQRGIQSVEVGGQLLLALVHQGRPMPLKQLAQEAGMPPAKAHPYLVSFGKIGLIAQDAASGHYGLGPLALQLGMISLQLFDPLRLATERLVELAAITAQTVAIAVWGNRGPTIVRVEQAPTPVHVTMRHGTVMSLRDTATGRVFAAHLPRASLAALEPADLVDPGFERELARVRLQGYSDVADGAVVGVSAVAVPVFDETGRILLVLTAIGQTAAIDLSAQGPVVSALRDCARELMQRIGGNATPQA